MFASNVYSHIQYFVPASIGFSSVTLSESMVPVSAATGDVNNFIRNGRTLSDIQNSVRVDASVASRLTESWGEQNANTDSVTWRSAV